MSSLEWLEARKMMVYLGSSAIVKRYVNELGSDAVGKVYLKVYAGEIAESL